MKTATGSMRQKTVTIRAPRSSLEPLRPRTTDVTVDLRALTLTGGAGSGTVLGDEEFDETGGGVSCVESTVVLSDVTITERGGDLGGALAAENCEAVFSCDEGCATTDP